MNDLVFQTISWYAKDVFNEEEKRLEYVIKTFGMTKAGETVSVSIKNFKPYFFIKLENGITIEDIERIVLNIKSTYLSIVNAKDFWGFSNDTRFQFVKLSFISKFDMQSFVSKVKNNVRINGKNVKLACYEYNIDPYIRFIHNNNIEPSEWLIIKRNKCESTTLLQTNSNIDLETSFENVQKYNEESSAPFLIASFDLECMSLTGDFPVPIKDYKKVASELHDLYFSVFENFPVAERVYLIQESLLYTLSLNQNEFKYRSYIHKVDPKIELNDKKKESLSRNIKINSERILQIFTKRHDDITISNRDSIITSVLEVINSMQFPQLKGDQIIQIGTTFHKYGDSSCCMKYIYTLGSCDDIEDAIVVSFNDEKELIIKWRDLIISTDPDIMTGYNIFGFDFWYIYERARDLGISEELMKIGRFPEIPCTYEEKKLSSSALGDNLLKYISMDGRVLIDIMKVVQRDHKLDSYKLDNVATHFIGMQKNDVTPQDIFRLQKGTSADRCIVAKYCIQDCSLCNHLMMKLEILANNIGMSNVCLVPLSFIFMRGQGIKIFSLILKQCRDAGYLIPVQKYDDKDCVEEDGVGYEGAIVLDPKEGIYIDQPVTVLDYASLYPSSMISENLSHDCLVIDQKYNNLPGVEYLDISYDIYEGNGDKKTKIGVHTCRFVQGKKGVIPNILNKLLQARKSTRKNMTKQKVVLKNKKEYIGFLNKDKTTITLDNNQIVTFDQNSVLEISDLYNEFQKAVLDGLQNAYKVTANSLYGQMGAKTSQVYMKEIAACTTATGRKMILMAKDFLEKEYNANIVYGDTDSIFCIFPTGCKGKEAIMPSIGFGIEASKKFKKFIKPPHDLEYEKTFWPFILLSKKRYVGNLYEDDDVKFKQKSMGIVLKRRDNAQIVKHVYGGIIDIILNKHDVQASVDFLKKCLDDLIQGNINLDQLIITKSLRSEYKDPTRIAHKVLADRIRDRDPGNAPQVNDRIPYAYIINKSKKCLQGDRIEHPDFIKKNDIRLDYEFYITNQIMKPVLQVYGIVVDQLKGNNMTGEKYEKIYQRILKEHNGDEKDAKEKFTILKENDAKEILFDPILRTLTNTNNKQSEITKFFTIKNKADFKPGDDLDVKTFNTKKRISKKKEVPCNKTHTMTNFFKKI